ncbi:hypothetical protein Tco_1021780 [Tanacetum coccineum]
MQRKISSSKNISQWHLGKQNPDIGQVPNSYGSVVSGSQPVAHVVVVLGESSDGGQLSADVSVGSRSSNLGSSSMQVTETRNADGSEMGNGIPIQSSTADRASKWPIM